MDEKRQVFLILRAQAGDRDAFDQLLESVQNELFGYLVNLLRDRADAEDALQATFLQAFRKLRWLRQPALFRAWIFRIASRIAFRIGKKRGRWQTTNLEAIDQFASPAMVDESDRNDLIERIPQWLDRLTLKSREAVILHYLKGFTTEQVADILGIPVGTAKSRISYALAAIRKHTNLSKGESQ